jgi:MFS superfamily sulfate permease-like transporter
MKKGDAWLLHNLLLVPVVVTALSVFAPQMLNADGVNTSQKRAKHVTVTQTSALQISKPQISLPLLKADFMTMMTIAILMTLTHLALKVSAKMVTTAKNKWIKTT